MEEVIKRTDHITVMPSGEPGKIALVLDGVLHSDHPGYTEALETAITMVNNGLNDHVEMYLDWVNNYTTLDKFCADYHLDRPDAENIIGMGKAAHEAAVANTGNQPTVEVVPPKNTIALTRDGEEVMTMPVSNPLTIEWHTYAADKDDLWGSAANEQCNVAEYCLWRFGPDHKVLDIIPYTPSVAGPSRPDPNEWYMWGLVNSADEDTIIGYAKDLKAIDDQATELGWSY